MIVLPAAENRTIVYSFVWTKHVTDRRMHRQIRCGCRVYSLKAPSTRTDYQVCCEWKQTLCIHYWYISLG